MWGLAMSEQPAACIPRTPWGALSAPSSRGTPLMGITTAPPAANMPRHAPTIGSKESCARGCAVSAAGSAIEGCYLRQASTAVGCGAWPGMPALRMLRPRGRAFRRSSRACGVRVGG